MLALGVRRPAAWHASEKLQGLIAVSEHGALEVQARLLILLARSIPESFCPYRLSYSAWAGEHYAVGTLSELEC